MEKWEKTWIDNLQQIVYKYFKYESVQLRWYIHMQIMTTWDTVSYLSDDKYSKLRQHSPGFSVKTIIILHWW